ncbi:MAG TPA: hypothetical protein VIK31_00080 [Propionibacteriaceae bacterium]
MKDIPDDLGRGPFTIHRAAELGLSERVLEGNRFKTPWSGVRTLRAASESLVDRCRAAALVLPDSAVFSHDTALHLGGWLTPSLGDAPARYSGVEPEASSPIHVTVPRHSLRPQRGGMVGHRSDLASDEIVDMYGLRITSPWRRWCDLGSSASKVDLVILADAVRRGRASDWRLRQDTSRRDLLEEEGWILRVFTSFDVFRAPERASERMRTALRMAGADV